MDTGRVNTIRGVATQGRGDWTQWVTSFTVSVSNDASSWTPVDGGVTFNGNVGSGDPVVINDFARPVRARYVNSHGAGQTFDHQIGGRMVSNNLA